MTDLEAEATAATKAAEKGQSFFEKTGTVGRALFMRQITTPKTNDDTRQERKTTSPTAEEPYIPCPTAIMQNAGVGQKQKSNSFCAAALLIFPDSKRGPSQEAAKG